jgi:hypothetical protein
LCYPAGHLGRPLRMTDCTLPPGPVTGIILSG